MGRTCEWSASGVRPETAAPTTDADDCGACRGRPPCRPSGAASAIRSAVGSSLALASAAKPDGLPAEASHVALRPRRTGGEGGRRALQDGQNSTTLHMTGSGPKMGRGPLMPATVSTPTSSQSRNRL